MLKVEAVSFAYPKAQFPALQAMSLELEKGRILGLLGPNGAGKSTLIGLLSGLLPLQSGELSVNGQSIVQMRKTHPTKLTVAPQEYAFYPTLTVEENLQCFAAVARVTRPHIKKRIQACLEISQLQNFFKKPADCLSGGLKRRLNLAIALLPEPEFLLLDEPTVGVDPQSRAFLLDAVRHLANEGMGVLYTSHYMEEIQQIADDVLIMDQGKCLKKGTLSALLESQQALTVRFVEAALEVSQQLELWSAQQVRDAFYIQVPPQMSAIQVLSRLESLGAKIASAEFGRNPLEQVFMSLTNRTLRD